MSADRRYSRKAPVRSEVVAPRRKDATKLAPRLMIFREALHPATPPPFPYLVLSREEGG